ncbi:MazG nucleotide pyrophosphohydrolase domain-containing protein [Arthrobacter sp. H35-D1]|uniref:MazG nucleotide pyrophosphohydrolase domain-containing protein n=1 Tax=Arthrobacter sp. H35-D1 TaxID=3046202 RepID=UPI0024B993EA|nr:MazG nucleotide pyrophosphohydrolase domain-containing protein [Arthrobacter sp. H35-D1]MDJ0312450.1 MazG nucleotide pyrophosphohydrolase domain-containing protein [Arthrobacter sp. H35-D1]
MNESSRRAGSSTDEMARLVGVVAALREHCPWTAALTHDSLTTYLLEESYELIEALETGHSNDIAAELGDILLQVVLHARLAEESGHFDVDDVARGLSEKLIRRSPHVFHADGTLQETFPATVAEIEETWERVKAAERAAALMDAGGDQAGVPSLAVRFSARSSLENPSSLREPRPGPTPSAQGPFAGIPRSLPALAMAQKSLERAARAGLAMPAAAAGPLDAGPMGGGDIATEGELGKVLFDVVRVAQQNGLDAERALRLAVLDFQRRPDTR